MRKFTIVLALLIFAGLQGVLAQTRVITGTVTSSEDKAPIPGVTVVVKGTTIGTTTNLDGKYVLTIPTKFNVLVFSYVGMKMKEITLGEANSLDIVLEPDVMNLDQVVVTAIGIPRETKALSYSVQNVGSEDIQKAARTDIINSLQGKVSDVQIINSTGVAGGAAYIQIRGVQSLTGNNQPLFVVDGIPIAGSETGGGYGVDGVAFSNRSIDLNPDDIESVNVLKGGAATALYGLRASSGAIIITTKKGKATVGKKVSVTFNTSVQFDQVSKLLPLQKAYGQGTGGNWVSGGRTTWGPKLDTCLWNPTLTGTSPTSASDPYNYWPGYDVDGQLVGKNNPNGKNPVSAYNPYDFFQTGLTTNNSLSLTGGSDISNFYFSFSDNQQKGVVPNNKFRRNTFKIAGETKLSDRFKVSGTANYIITTGNRIQQGSNTSGVMLGLERTPPSFDNSAGYLNPDPAMYPTKYQRSYRHGSGYDNPYWTANQNSYKDYVNRLLGSAQVDYFANKWLSFTYRIGVDFFSRKAKDMLAKGSSAQTAGWCKETLETNKDFNSDLLMTIDKDLTKDFNLKFILGQNMTQHQYTGLYAQANDLVIPEYYNLNNTTNVTASEATTIKRTAGIYGDLQLSYANMVYLSATGRNDWSTTLPEGNNSFFYPSVGAGFIFTQLPGLKDSKALPYGKIRVSYAITAKDVDPYQTLTYWVQPFVTDGWTSPAGITFPYNGYTSYTLSDNNGNPKLKPEKTKTFETGFDLKLVQNRIGLSYTYFNNKGQDLILQVPIAATTGYTTQFMNAASMRTQGHEITLDLVPVKSKDWQWNINVNWSLIRNKVLELAPGVDNLFLGGFTDPQIRAVKDQPYRSIFGYGYKHDANGNLLIDDNGYPIQGDNMIALGNVDPDWTMGIGSDLKWKNLSLYFLLDFKTGGKMWDGTRGALEYFGTGAGTLNRDETTIFEGIVESTGLPNTTRVSLGEGYRSGVGSGFTGPSIDYIEKSGWFRVRTIRLAYSFTSLVNKTFIKGLDIYVTATNLILVTPYKGIDPETNLQGASNAQGMDYFNMPGTKSYAVGLNLAF